MKNKVISKEVALIDLESFVNKFLKKPLTSNEAEDTYPDVLDAIMEGLVVFNENGVPVYTLKNPIKNEAGEVSISEINFKTRIKPLALAGIAKGIDLKNDVLTLQLRMVSFIIDQPFQMIDKFERYDYDVINQISTVFT